MDSYALCPCGSGKKFKWCCQPIHQQIDKAFDLDQKGQHDAALQLMDDVVAQHPDNPEVFGRKALLQFQNDKAAEAELTLEKAFELNSNYAYGYFLKGQFRNYEGELPGALILYRKAADLYSPEAKEISSQLYLEIFDCEMKLNHPLAAHAAAATALRMRSNDAELKQGIDRVFGAENRNLPITARKVYTFRTLPPGSSEQRIAAWAQALKKAATGKLADAVQAFEQVTRDDAENPAGWYNLAITQAWIGNNRDAVAALEKYVALETDLKAAAEGWALAEVLLLGQGLEDQADLVEYVILLPLRNPQQFIKVLGDLEREGVMVGTQVNEEEGMLTCLLLEEPALALTPELQAKQSPKLGAYLMMMGNIVRIWNVNQESLKKMFEKLRSKAVGMFEQPIESRGPAKYQDVSSQAITYPRAHGSKEDAILRVTEGAERYYEEVWPQRPLKSLGGVTPFDAMGFPPLRKKLLGIVQFVEECNELTKLPYDFTRLRSKLGLLDGSAPTPVIAVNNTTTIDVTSMGTAELAGLKLESLSFAEIEQAFQTALKLDSVELAGRFAESLVAFPHQADKPDRFTVYQFLMQQATKQGNATSALNWLNAGESHDCSHNEGKRRNDYELRRGQILAKTGDFGQAREIFDRLIQRVPGELRFRVAAAETMLSARQGADAKRYAQEGLAEAAKQNQRDVSEHFKELAAAAQKQG